MKIKSLQHKIYDTLLTDIKNGDTDLADVLLIKMGYNLDKINALGEKIDKSQLFLIKARINQQKQAQLLEKASQQIHRLLYHGQDRPLAYIKELLGRNGIPCFNSNLEKLDLEEIKEMIKDINYLELLERLEKENEEEQ